MGDGFDKDISAEITKAKEPSDVLRDAVPWADDLSEENLSPGNQKRLDELMPPQSRWGRKYVAVNFDEPEDLSLSPEGAKLLEKLSALDGGEIKYEMLENEDGKPFLFRSRWGRHKLSDQQLDRIVSVYEYINGYFPPRSCGPVFDVVDGRIVETNMSWRGIEVKFREDRGQPFKHFLIGRELKRMEDEKAAQAAKKAVIMCSL